MWEASGTGAIVNIAWGLTLGAVLNYFWMTAESLTILSAVLLLDWIFWVINAFLKWNLQSKLMATWLIRKASRWCVPFIVIIVLKWAWFENIDLIKTSMLSILIIAEWYSIIWHIYSINYKQDLPEIDALKMLLEWIANHFKWKIDEKWKEKSE